MIDRPEDLFDRQWEWSTLTSHVAATSDLATLGVVSGRRRQGKSYVLERLCQATGGFYHLATEATDHENRQLLSSAIAEFEGRATRPHLPDWPTAIDALLRLGPESGIAVVIDEFPFLCKPTPELPSVILRALSGSQQKRGAARSRLLLCGSAQRFMGSLLSGAAPLRGRAGLELVIRSFDYRTAAEFWAIYDPALAVRVHAVVGGTPAYAREFTNGDHPSSLNDFDDWVCRTALSTSSPLFREGKYLLAEDVDIRETALYHSVLAAIAGGNSTRGGIANYIGRPADALAHPLTVLEDAGFIAREDDAFNARRSTYVMREPIIAFYHALIRPDLGALANPKNTERVWQARQPTFRAKVLGPHFEALCRDWTLSHADEGTFGAMISAVGVGTVNDATAKATAEIDVVAFDIDRKLVGIGEAKWGERIGTRHLDRLRHVRALLATSGRDVTACKLALYSGVGFSDELLRAANDDVVLVDLQRLYHGA
jgi:uncharacterized protein